MASDPYAQMQADQTTRRLHDYVGDLRAHAASMARQLEHVHEFNGNDVTGALRAAVQSCVDVLDKALAATKDKLP